MNRYESYKDSGVKWLGEIPSHWEVKKLRAFFDRRNQKVSDKDYAPLSVTKKGIVPQMENVAKSKDSDNRRLVKVGDFVINSRSDRKGSSGVSQLEGSVSFVNTVMTPKVRILPSFSNYLLKSFSFIEENYRNGHGIVADLWTTSFDEQKHIYLAVPPKEEQEAIVDYLDKVTGDIDKAIEAQQKLIEALNERKQIFITKAVTKGLNPEVTLKDSGIDWLGQIPKTWEVSKIKRHSKVILGKMLDSKGGNLSKIFPYICSKDVNFDSIDLTNLKEMFFSEKEIEQYKVSNGDLLVVEGGSAGKCCIAKNIDKTIGIQNSILIIREERSLLNTFLAYQLQSLVKKGFVESSCNKATFLHYTKEKVENTNIALPPIEEQKEIVKYIDDNISPLNAQITNCEKMISLLQERKQIIINDVVTGKKKVI